MKTRLIPVGAIKIPLPDIEQPDEFSCGAASLMSICSYYDVGSGSIEGFKQATRTDPDDGAHYQNLARYARSLGLEADIHTGMSVKALKKHLDAGRPVICSIQAYSEDKHPDYCLDGHGHYVVAIGYSKRTIYFMDPSANYEGARKSVLCLPLGQGIERALARRRGNRRPTRTHPATGNCRLSQGIAAAGGPGNRVMQANSPQVIWHEVCHGLCALLWLKR